MIFNTNMEGKMKFEIKNRWSGSVQFVAEIEADENALLSVKTGLAVRWGFKTSANLTGANLTEANLTGANLAWANLAGANLTGAKLFGANLAGANLFGAFMWIGRKKYLLVEDK